MNPVDHATQLLRSRAGLKEEPASRARLERLLDESAQLAGIPIPAYVDLLDSKPAAFDDLLDRVTVQHSAFFRDPAQFAALSEIVRKASGAPHTVWSAGCGNGQEPYSLAMLLDETGRHNWKVVATDVSFRALARTEIARYGDGELRGLSPERQRRYTTPIPGGYEIAQFIRRYVHISHHNLALADAGPLTSKVDAVFCEACIQRIAEHLVPGGYLFLGHSDSPGRMTRLFEPVRVADAFCYRRLSAPAPAAPAVARRQVLAPPCPDLAGLMAEGDHAAASGDLRAAVRAFRQATYLNPNLAIAYFQLGAALELAGDPREARRSFAAAGLAMMSGDGAEDLSGLEGYSQRDLARAIASKLTEAR